MNHFLFSIVIPHITPNSQNLHLHHLGNGNSKSPHTMGPILITALVLKNATPGQQHHTNAVRIVAHKVN
jgi:hypothetical protein